MATYTPQNKATQTTPSNKAKSSNVGNTFTVQQHADIVQGGFDVGTFDSQAFDSDNYIVTTWTNKAKS